MGGVAANSKSFHPASRLTFTPIGVLQLARAGLLPDITDDEVEERSKADNLAKIGVCVQVIWFSVQSAVRVSKGLPLTLLEVHTIAHMFCALIMYLLWWTKPYEMGSPIICDDPNIVAMAALFSLHDQADTNFSRRCATTDSIDMATIKNVECRPKEGPQVDEHFKLANEAVAHWKRRNYHFDWRIDGEGYITFRDEYLVDAIENDGIDGKISTSFKGRAQKLGLNSTALSIAFSIAYGGFHLSAWAYQFPTRAEMWAWRACGIALALGPIIDGVETIMKYFLHRRPYLRSQRLEVQGQPSPSKWRKLMKGVYSCVNWLSFSWYLIYPNARLFLLVESFVSLRKVPSDTYQTVVWTGFIPHVS